MKCPSKATIATALAFAFAIVTPSSAAAALSLVKVGDFADPTFMTSPPGDAHRLFVVQRGGAISVVRDGVVQSTPFVDLSGVVDAQGEGGLLSMAFPPDYAKSGRFYVYYTAARSGDPAGDVVTIAALKRSATNPDVADPASLRTLLTVDHPNFTNHNGGQLEFGPDGLLYIGIGDGGSSNDPPNNAQNKHALLGKILRIRPTPGKFFPYVIPAGNPFPDGSRGAREVWSYGLRNPWRFSFDRLTGDLVIGDVGQNTEEEVDWTAKDSGAGLDYGWHCDEGTFSTPGVSPACTPSGIYAPPVFEYAHSTGGCAVIGGYVVRDRDLPSLYGRYLYSDLCIGDIRSLALARPTVTDHLTTGLSVSSPVSFGEDSCGHVYVTAQSSEVDRIQEGTTFNPCKAPPPPDVTPPHLRLTVTPVQTLDAARSIRAALRCDERCHVALTGEVYVPKNNHHFAIPAQQKTFGVRQRVELSIPVSKRGARAARKAIGRGWRVWVHLTFKGRDDHRNVRRVRRAVRLVG